MLIVEIIGGLGNQLFQYSFGRQLALKHNIRLKLDISGFENYPLHQFSLQHFNIAADIASKEDIAAFKPLQPGFIGKTLFQVKRKLGWTKVFKEAGFHFQPEALHFPGAAYLSGYWQSESYFKGCQDQLRQDLQIITPPNPHNQLASQKIQGVNSISLHIRRGDYITDSQAHQVHGICSLDYYDLAIEYLVKRVDQPHFFIFSDDPEWVRANLKISYPHHFMSHNDSATNYEDLRLMSFCQHNIIANSSFSWWGAWLNRNPNKIVIAPKRWFNTPERNAEDLVPEEWIKL